MSGCLPPATLQPAEASVAELAADPETEPERCRALIGEIGELDDAGRFSTRELRWGSRKISEDTREGLVVGDAESLFELTIERRDLDPSELYGEAEVRCHEDRIMLRKLPDGVARPLIVGRAACVGSVDGERLALESSLRVVSALGPYVGWREQVEGNAPEPTSKLDYETIDVRDGRELNADVWLLEPTATMRSAFESIGLNCERDDAPQSTSAVDGFAIGWLESGEPRLRIGYRCCDGRSCELDEPLPKIDAELAVRLPDPDRLLHSPYGCGSIGLDGQVRGRDGVAVGRVGIDPGRLIGVLFLPVDHSFELDW